MSMNVGGGRGPFIAIGCLIAFSVAILAVWQMQAGRMRRDFREAAAAGRLNSLPIGLRDRIWSPADLATAEVIHLDPQHGTQRASLSLLHTRGTAVISEDRYSYQATVTDTTTGIRHVFGYRRNPPGAWEYITVHPDSARQYIQQHVRDHPVPARRGASERVTSEAPANAPTTP